jgi:hypothetical protein
MKVYTFIFSIGLINLVVPFLGIPFVYKNFTLITLAIFTIGYSLIIRAIQKEKQNMNAQRAVSVEEEKPVIVQSKKIEDVVEMVEEKETTIVSDVVPKRRGRKAKVVVQEEVQG